jgi:hypothetical protein
MATTPCTLTEPIRVADLPLPPEVAASLDKHSRTCGFTARECAMVEDDFKLRYHYAGHFIMATAGPSGLLIHAIDLENPDEVRELSDRLNAQGHRHVLCLFPTPWDDPVPIVTVNSKS